MAEGKKKVIVYTDWIDQFKDLTDEEAGKLIKHFFEYVNDLNPKSDRLTELLFNPIKATLKRDLEAWENKQKINKENGLKGGRPKTKNNPNNPVGFLETHDNPKKGDSVSVSVNDNDNVTHTNMYASEVLPENEKPLILPEHFDKMLAYFNKTFNKDIKQITRYQRENFYNLIRKGYTQFTIKDVIDNLKNDEFCKSRNYIHVTIDYISQVETVEKYAFVHLANKQEPKPTKGYGVSWL
jgi:hypothetical protein